MNNFEIKDEKIMKERIAQFKINWITEPFPHAIIDNFLPPDIFSKVCESLANINSFQDIKKSFQTHVENNKKVYGDKDLNEILKLPINILGGLPILLSLNNLLIMNPAIDLSFVSLPRYSINFLIIFNSRNKRRFVTWCSKPFL